MKKQLALGTAQIGMNYGITNKKGRIRIEEVYLMLEKAREGGIKILDTAQEYGIAEKIIGESELRKNFSIVTKMTVKEGEHLEDWTRKCRESRQRLNVEYIDTLLVHNPDQIDRQMSLNLAEWSQNIKREGVNKFGVSIYKEEDLINVDLNYIDAVQLPLSVYNQEHIQNGLISKLKRFGIEIQARSCFMQGLILTDHREWPKNISQKLRMHHKMWEDHMEKSKLTKMSGALGFCKQSEADIILIGATSCDEIKEITEAWNKKSNKDMDSGKWAWNTGTDTDPRNWKKGITS